MEPAPRGLSILERALTDVFTPSATIKSNYVDIRDGAYQPVDVGPDAISISAVYTALVLHILKVFSKSVWLVCNENLTRLLGHRV